MALKTNFTDDILAESMNGKRQYNVTENSNGTKSLEDATDYQSVGSTFSAKDMNETNAAVNQAYDDMGDEFNKNTKYLAGAVKIHNNKLWKFKVDHDPGEWDESQVRKTTLLDEIGELNEKITIPLTPVSQVTGYFAQLYKQGNHIFGNGRIAGMTSLPKVESVSSFDNWTGNLVAAATTGLRRIFSTSGNPFKLENNIYHIIGCGTRSTYNGTTGAIVTNSSVVAAMFDGENTHILLQYDAIPSASGSTQSGVFFIDTMV